MNTSLARLARWERGRRGPVGDIEEGPIQVLIYFVGLQGASCCALGTKVVHDDLCRGIVLPTQAVETSVVLTNVLSHRV